MPYYDERAKKWRGVVRRMGIRKQKTFRTKGEATKWEVETIKVLEERASRKDRITLFEAANEYLDLALKKFHKTTYQGKAKALRDFLTYLRGRYNYLDEITPKEVHQFIHSKPSVIQTNRARKELHAWLAFCQRIYGLQANPAAATDKLREVRKRQPVPTEKEISQLLAACDRHDRNFIIAFILTGGRKSEILRWTFSDDIDFEKGRVRLGTRKTSSGEMNYRWVPMSKELRAALQDQYNTRLKKSDYVFQVRTKASESYGGRFEDRKHFVKKLSLKVLGKPYGYHSLRRFFASIQADKFQTSLPTLQKLLGHSRATTTERYIEVISSDQQEAIEQMDGLEIFQGSSGNTFSEEET